MSDQDFDLVIIGGGINGVGIARDAAGRGLKTLLCESRDLAEGTSSKSTKLIHGGLRYLEMYEFGLVRKALKEREVLLKAAPHIIWPLRFVLPHDKNLRPAWMIRLGLFLYDHLGAREVLPGSRYVDFNNDPVGAPLNDKFKVGFEYSDCWVDDARLVVLNALAAAEQGGEILTRTECTRARRDNGIWEIDLKPSDGAPYTVRAKCLVNAAGPWAGQVMDGVIGSNRKHALRLVKGSHLITRKLFEGEQCYIFQNDDKRIVFAIPYQNNYTMIGTTDEPFDGAPEAAEISPEETDYLLEVASRSFGIALGHDDIVSSFSGVRPLHDDESENAAKVTREYVLDLDAPDGQAPLLSVFGGKITTYRKLAEHALERVQGYFPAMGPEWTRDATLPGGDIPYAELDRYRTDLAARYAWAPAGMMERFFHQYGTRSDEILDGKSRIEDLGEELAPGLYEAEARYLTDVEWARCADDIIWRRTKVGLAMGSDHEKLDQWFAKQ